mmetsp:Transcript_40307/g.29718  ORF Transcript_40307/g.29718 Transcript_40307/m.29718 type:complete len:92 (+) Transcript_40307:387-662(+)
MITLVLTIVGLILGYGLGSYHYDKSELEMLINKFDYYLEQKLLNLKGLDNEAEVNRLEQELEDESVKGTEFESIKIKLCLKGISEESIKDA